MAHSFANLRHLFKDSLTITCILSVRPAQAITALILELTRWIMSSNLQNVTTRTSLILFSVGF